MRCFRSCDILALKPAQANFYGVGDEPTLCALEGFYGVIAPEVVLVDIGAHGPGSGRSHEAVSALATEIASKHGLELVKVHVGREGRRQVVRVFLDKPGGVTLQDCEAVSQELSRRLDVLDPVKGPYTLEVSSPGLDRPLEKEGDFVRFAGRRVDVCTYSPVAGKKKFQAVLLGLDEEGRVLLEVGAEKTAISRREMASIKLVPEIRF